MKKATIIAALLAALMLIVSCGGGAGGNPEDDLFNGIAGYSTLNASVPSLQSLLNGESWLELNRETDISAFTGTWASVSVETHISPAPQYAKKTTVQYVIEEDSSTPDAYTCTSTYIYDYTAAMAELGNSYWETIKSDDIPSEGYTINDYVATQTSGNYTEDVSTINDVFGDFWYPEAIEIYINGTQPSEATKIQVYNTNSQQMTIWVKQAD